MALLNCNFFILMLLVVLENQINGQISRYPDGIRCQYGDFSSTPPTNLTFILQKIDVQANIVTYVATFTASSNYINLFLTNATLSGCSNCGSCAAKHLSNYESQQRTFNLSKRSDAAYIQALEAKITDLTTKIMGLTTKNNDLTNKTNDLSLKYQNLKSSAVEIIVCNDTVLLKVNQTSDKVDKFLQSRSNSNSSNSNVDVFGIAVAAVVLATIIFSIQIFSFLYKICRR